MINQQFVTKYDRFFNEVKDLLKLLDWADDKTFVGLSEQEIKEIERSQNVKITGGFKSYLQHFGKRGHVKQHVSFQYNLNTMKKAEEEEVLFNEDLEEHEKAANWLYEIREDLTKKDLYENQLKPILLRSGLENDFIFFTMEQQSEFTVGHYEIYNRVTSNFHRYVDYYRSILFNSFLFLLKRIPWNKRSMQDHLDNKDIINKIPWIKFYEELEKTTNKHKVRLRIPFDLAVQELEKKTGRFMGIDEYEIERIKYLIETGEVEPMPEIFDPYAELVTFYDYLK